MDVPWCTFFEELPQKKCAFDLAFFVEGLRKKVHQGTSIHPTDR